ncbi:GNAT family N-acetyltransferase [Paenibacillus tengchongensis]|uniref:GNAT family N-acetyltransferase n=1 Tax=Paenibacillus tengchongensis TaxID=2608684 RepID=UPI001FE3CFDE|nr:GNAT family protein [Paenibacillus tengchongensis]
MCGGRIPPLQGPRLKLRELLPEDAEALFKIWTDPLVAPWLDAPPLTSEGETLQLIGQLRQMSQDEESLRWSITGPEGTVIGSCGYNFWQLPGAYRGELGCELAPSCWGQGYMHEALRLVMDFGFGTMGLNRIEALCHPDNLRAEQLFGSLGFRQEGVLRQFRHTPSGFRDVVMHAILQNES